MEMITSPFLVSAQLQRNLLKVLRLNFTVFGQPSTKITMDFLNTGILPAAQESELVSVYAPGMTRKPISDPYQVPTGALAGDVDGGNVTVEIPF
jgi:hypothetical protein